MSKNPSIENGVSTREAANAIGVNASKITDYRDRGLLEGMYEKRGRNYFYDLEKITDAIRGGVNTDDKHAVNESEEETLKKLGIKSKIFSERKKAHYVALGKELEYKRASDKLIEVDQFKSDLAEEAAEMKYAFETLGPKMAPVLSTMDDINEIEEYINSQIGGVLINLFSRFVDE